jgi:hypothetical protein
MVLSLLGFSGVIFTLIGAAARGFYASSQAGLRVNMRACRNCLILNVTSHYVFSV